MPLNLLDPTQRLVIAHRGASADAPENTLPAFALALEQGCDALECDVRLTRDGVPVVMHDPTFERIARHAGTVGSMSLVEVQAVDVAATFVTPGGGRRWSGRGVRVPALVEVLRRFPHTPVLIEIKEAAAQEAVAHVLIEEQAVDRCLVASFQRQALESFHRKPFLVGASQPEIVSLYWRSRLGIRPRTDCLAYAVPDYWKGRFHIPRPEVVRAARRTGRPVHVWTVDDPDRAVVLWRRGVSGVITNRPGVMRVALDREQVRGQSPPVSA